MLAKILLCSVEVTVRIENRYQIIRYPTARDARYRVRANALFVGETSGRFAFVRAWIAALLFEWDAGGHVQV